MAESAGRYCALCGEAVGLVDRFCRRCGETLQVPGMRPGKSKLEVEPGDETSTTRSTSRAPSRTVPKKDKTVIRHPF